MYCVKCGREVPSEALYCPGCGSSGTILNEQQPGVPSRLIYVLLAWLLGVLGIHNFYAGYWGRGLIQLLGSCCFIGAPVVVLWVFFEVLFQTTDAYGRPMRHSPFTTMLIIIYIFWQILVILGSIILVLGALGASAVAGV